MNTFSNDVLFGEIKKEYIDKIKELDNKLSEIYLDFVKFAYENNIEAYSLIGLLLSESFNVIDDVIIKYTYQKFLEEKGVKCTDDRS